MSECYCQRRFRVQEYEMLERIESKVRNNFDEESDHDLMEWVIERLQEAHDYLELNDCYCE